MSATDRIVPPSCSTRPTGRDQRRPAVGIAMGEWLDTAAIWVSRQAAHRPWLTGPEDSPAGDSRALHHAHIASM